MAFDPHRANVVLLCRCEGTPGSAAFVDDTGKTLSVTGPAAISAAQARFGTASADLTSASTASVATANHSDFAIGTGDVTAECFVYPTVGGTFRDLFQCAISGGGYWQLRIANTNRLQLGAAGSATRITGNLSVPLDQWSHVAITRDSGVWRMWLDGFQDGSTYSDSSDYGLGLFRFGGSFPSRAYLDNVRVTKGVARYGSLAPTADFSVTARTVSGTVTDESGNPVARTVRAYHRASGVLLAETTSDPVTGAYTLTVPTTDEVCRVVVAQDAGTPGPTDPVLPDLIDRVIPG